MKTLKVTELQFTLVLFSFLVSRNNGVPPAPPTLKIIDSSHSTISLGWMPPPVDGGAPITAYRLHHHREFGDWDRLDISPNNTSYSFDGLRCGTNYQFYIQALNDFGVGERTETVSAQTKGSAPIAPQSTTHLIKVNSSSIILDLAAWMDGGCPITSFVVEYQKIRAATTNSKSISSGNPENDLNSGKEVTISVDDDQYAEDNEWILVNNNVKPRSVGHENVAEVLMNKNEENNKGTREAIEEGFSVLDLSPETHYKLRMTAHNSAGSTVRIYTFTTLTFGGATVAPELIIHSEYNYGFLKLLINPSVVLPVLLALCVIICMMVFVVHQLKKDRFLVRGKLFIY